MGNANSVIKKVSAVLKKVGPPSRLAYLRTVTRANSDSLLGHVGTVTPSDTLFDPQPYYFRLGRQIAPGGHAKAEDVIDSAGNIRLADDYQFIFSPDAISSETLSSPDLFVVLKDAAGNEDVFRMTDHDSPMIYGEEVVHTCYMRSIKRP